MLRSALVSVCRLLLWIFFRRIEVVGKHHLPQDGALLFALNHPSGLIDPLFILCLAERRVSFLAKEPLFRMPFVGIFVKAFESLPVYRSRDGGDPAKNRAMMVAAAQLLARGNALALFPEGTSHSDTDLKRFRSGAARIALSARALGDQPVRIVPAALYYETKEVFRSRAVLAFGKALDIPQVELDDAGNSPREVGSELTAELEKAIRGIMPTADNAEGLILAELAERVFLAGIRDTPQSCPQAVGLSQETLDSELNAQRPSLGTRMKTRRRLIDAYSDLIVDKPAEVKSLAGRIITLRDELEGFGLPIDAGRATSPSWWKQRAPRYLWATLLLPAFVLGVLLHYATYQLIRVIATKVSSSEADVTATVKLLAGLLLFPLTWLLWAGLASWHFDDLRLLSLAALGPFLAWGTVTFQDVVGALGRGAKHAKSRRSSNLDFEAIQAKRGEIAEDMAELLQAWHSP